MLGAIAGDIAGSIYKFQNIKTKDFPLFNQECTFTNDTLLTIAVAEVILNAPIFPDNTKYIDQFQYAENFKLYYSEYPDAGYCEKFQAWAESNSNEPYKSWGHGSATRVSPIASAFDDLNTVLQEAENSSVVTHNHIEGIKSAQAIAAAIFLARTGHDKATIKSYIQNSFEYNLNLTLNEIRPKYQFKVKDSCQEFVPQAMIAFLESTDFEDAIRNAISIGGDTNSVACITGGIAEAFYGGVPQDIAEWALSKLDAKLWSITDQFMSQYYA
ncbi:MAG: ADP-ribosylglycohydrolase family protein [Cuspidothrix sp.]